MEPTVLCVLQMGCSLSHRSRPLVDIAFPHLGERNIVKKRERHFPGLLYIHSAQWPCTESKQLQQLLYKR
jgi:hypothetical protein